MADAPDILIWVLSEKLSDGSEVWSVELPGGEKLAAVSENDAAELAEKIADAINEHTTNTAGTMA